MKELRDLLKNWIQEQIINTDFPYSLKLVRKSPTKKYVKISRNVCFKDCANHDHKFHAWIRDAYNIIIFYYINKQATVYTRRYINIKFIKSKTCLFWNNYYKAYQTT